MPDALSSVWIAVCLGTILHLWLLLRACKRELQGTFRLVGTLVHKRDELRETLAVVGGERDSLQLRVQQLEADEDRLDWLGETATMAQVVMLACALNERDDVREAIDALRTAGK